MCCGYELTAALPSDQDYRAAKKEEVKDILQFVFKEDQIEHVRIIVIITKVQDSEKCYTCVHTTTVNLESFVVKIFS